MRNKKTLFIALITFLLSSCGETTTLNKVVTDCDHVFENRIVEPTCTERGYTEFKCTKCQYQYKTNFVNAYGHVFKYFNKTEPSFGVDGMVEHYECNLCHKFFDTSKKEIDEQLLHTHLSIYDFKDSEEPVFFVGKDLSFSYNENNYTNIINSAKNLITKINNATADYGSINLNINSISDGINSIQKIYSKASLVANIYNRPSDYELSTKCYSQYMNLFSLYYKVYYALYKQPAYSDYFYGMTSKELELFLNNCKIYADDEVVESNTKMDQILADYTAGKKDKFVSISEYTTEAKKFANLLGYENYLYYAQENVYGRDYTVEDTENLYLNIKNYIVPLFNKVNNALANYNYNALFSQQKDKYKTAIETSNNLTKKFYGNYLSELDSYANFLGGNYLTNFHSYFEDENYYYSNIKNDNITAYVTTLDGTPIMFMSPKYQNVTTFIHEFGHYNAQFTYGGVGSYDIAETQSQGNEMLFYTYLIKNNLIDELSGKHFLLNCLSKMLDSVIIGYEINEVEKFAYKANFTKQELEQKWIDVGRSLGQDNSGAIDYLYLVLLNYNCYYISYATSAIASLEIFAKAVADINLAKQSYQEVYDRKNNGKTFLQLLKAANLENIFTKDAYTLINTLSSFVGE